MQKESSQAQLDDSVQQIDQGLNAAYRQLRELLTTFRIKVNEPGLRPAVQATIEEFGANSGLQILSDYRLDHCPLTPNEEVHCLQIIREALSNVVKHAEADRCWLSLTQDSNGTIHVRIEDDGIGIRPARHHRRHREGPREKPAAQAGPAFPGRGSRLGAGERSEGLTGTIARQRFCA